jgi:hypothetical protein
VGPVVVDPLHRNLQQALALPGVDQVGFVVSHQARVVDEAIFLEQRGRCWFQLPRGRAVSTRSRASDRFQDFETADHDPLLLILVDEIWALVEIAVVTHLVAATNHLLQDIGMALGGEAGNEERRRDVVLLQEIEDARHADIWPVGRLRLEGEALGRVLRIVYEGDALSIHVEREHGGAAIAVRPGKVRHE